MGNAASAPVVVDHRRGRASGRAGGHPPPPPAGAGVVLPRPSLTQPNQPQPQQRSSYGSRSQPQPPRRSNSGNNNNDNKPGPPRPPVPPVANNNGGPSARRPPPQLNSNEPFLVISPASDVSNPSNFHHLKRRTQQTPVRDRRRASRVFHTQPAENHNNSSFVIARPNNFYLSEASTSNNNHSALINTNELSGVHHHGMDHTPWKSSDRHRLLAGGKDDELGKAACDDVVPPPHRAPTSSAIQRVKQAVVGCLQDVLLNPGGGGHHGPPHQSRHYYQNGHIQLVSTQSTLSPVEDDIIPRRHRYSTGGPLHDSDNADPIQDDLVVVPPDTAGFDRHKPIDPNIPSSVECNFRSMMNDNGAGTHLHHPRMHHPFASILESADESSGRNSGSSRVGATNPAPVTTGGRDSPVCLLFADEANHEPNFSTSIAVVRREPATMPPTDPDHERRQTMGVVDESAYLLEHPSALYEEPSHLLHVSGHEAFRAASTSFGMGAVQDHDDDETRGHQQQRLKNHNQWLNKVLDIQQKSRNDLYELKKKSLHGAGVVVTAPSFATTSTTTSAGRTSTGPALDKSKANEAKGQQQPVDHEQERIRQAVADNVQRQINAKLRNQQQQASRGRSAEPRQRHKSRGGSTDVNNNNESIVQRNRKIFERPGGSAAIRSSSMPPSPAPRPIAATRKMQRNSRSRSSSVPNRRSSTVTEVDDQNPNPPRLPALLQLAGWQPPPPEAVQKKRPPPPKPLGETEGKPRPLPGLLQLSSSWNAHAGGGTDKPQHRGVLDPNKRLSDPFPLRRQANLGYAANQGTRQRHSEPLPQRPLPATARSSDVGVRVDGRSDNVAVTRASPVPNRPSSTSIAVQTSPIEADSHSKPIPAKHPDRVEYKDNHLTIAHILSQTYPLGLVESDDDEDDASELAGKRRPTADYMKYTYVAPSPAIPTQSPGVMSAHGTDGMSPAASVAVTHEASSNAAFLFTSNEQGHYPATTQSRPPPTFGISTIDSVHRVSGLTPFAPRLHPSIESLSMPPTPHGVESLTMPPVENDDRRSFGSGSLDSVGNRHVRFTDSTQKREAFRSRSKSGGNYPVVTTYPAIDSKLSDLTDTHNHQQQQQQLVVARSFDSAVSSSTHQTIHEGVDEIVDDEASDVIVGDAELMLSTPPQDLESDASPKESAAKNWAYRQVGGQGVTPYRPGGNNAGVAIGEASRVTNSPFVRFSEARSKFTATKEPPLKRSSPSPKAKWAASAREVGRVSGGLVHQRIVAMEAAHSHAANNSPVRTTKPRALPQRVRRETTGHDVIAPRKSTLVSPLFRPIVPTSTVSQASAVGRPVPTTSLSTIASGPAATTRSSVGSQQIHRSRDSSSTAESEYGEIKQANIIDEDSLDGHDRSVDHELSPATLADTRSVISEEEDEDAFAALLQGSDDDTEDEEGEDETVSTILQSRLSSGTSKYANFRLSSGETTTSSGSTISAVKRHRLSFPLSDDSTALSSKQSETFAFRDESLVRPNEQKPPKNAKGRLHLSPMQRTPMQARKWRALAAEAKASHRAKSQGSGNGSAKKGSLAERHPNVVHPWR